MEDTLTGGRFVPRNISGDAAPRIPSRARGVGVTKSGRSQHVAAGNCSYGADHGCRNRAESVREGLSDDGCCGSRARVDCCCGGRKGCERSGECAARRFRQIEAMAKAIIDSGASSDFGGRDLELDNAVPGEALVSLANDVQERVEEKGNVFPLENVRKVSSFPRPLVSVRKLVEKHERLVL